MRSMSLIKRLCLALACLCLFFVQGCSLINSYSGAHSIVSTSSEHDESTASDMAPGTMSASSVLKNTCQYLVFDNGYVLSDSPPLDFEVILAKGLVSETNRLPREYYNFQNGLIIGFVRCAQASDINARADLEQARKNIELFSQNNNFNVYFFETKTAFYFAVGPLPLEDATSAIINSITGCTYDIANN